MQKKVALPKVDLTQQTEPRRKSFLSIVQNNLRHARKKTYVHRLIYIGEHKFRVLGKHSIGRCMEKTILKVNNEYNDEPLTGLLLVYPKYFCHMLEGSEDSLIKHLRILFLRAYAKRLGRMKVLVCYHHCNQRFFRGWLAVTGKPLPLLKKIHVRSNHRVSTRIMFQCIKKLYKLAMLCRPQLTKADKKKRRIQRLQRKKRRRRMRRKRKKAGKTGLNLPPSPPRKHRSGRLKKRLIAVLVGKNPGFLPQYGVLDFLLCTKYTQSVRQYLNTFGVIKPLQSYKDIVWPVPCEFIPFNTFDEPYDPITDLPSAEVEEAEAPVDVFNN